MALNVIQYWYHNPPTGPNSSQKPLSDAPANLLLNQLKAVIPPSPVTKESPQFPLVSEISNGLL